MKKKIVLVGSKNPTKINAVSGAFKKVFKNHIFTFVGKKTPSGVSNQPMSGVETKKGCKNRLFFLEKNYSADFYVAIEGGLSYEKQKLFAFAWVYIKTQGQLAKSKTSVFQLPKNISALVEKGFELGEADDFVFKRKNSKKKDGAIGILTKGIITRESYYKQAVILSLIPFLNKNLVF